MQMIFPGGVRRWDISRSTFRDAAPSINCRLTDLSQTLREKNVLRGSDCCAVWPRVEQFRWRNKISCRGV